MKNCEDKSYALLASTTLPLSFFNEPSAMIDRTIEVADPTNSVVAYDPGGREITNMVLVPERSGGTKTDTTGSVQEK